MPPPLPHNYICHSDGISFVQDGKSGRTPLHYAVEFELLPVIQLLMNSGANVNAASFSGNTPIQTASGRGLHHVTKLLLGNLQDASGRESKQDSSRYKVCRYIKHQFD